jgi:hypothetical protein
MGEKLTLFGSDLGDGSCRKKLESESDRRSKLIQRQS